MFHRHAARGAQGARPPSDLLQTIQRQVIDVLADDPPDVEAYRRPPAINHGGGAALQRPSRRHGRPTANGGGDLRQAASPPRFQVLLPKLCCLSLCHLLRLSKSDKIELAKLGITGGRAERLLLMALL